MGQPARKGTGSNPEAKYPRLVDDEAFEPSQKIKNENSTNHWKTLAIGLITFFLVGFVFVGVWQGWLRA